MTKKEEHFIEAKAYENTDFHYFRQLVKPEWVCTPTSPLDNFDERNFTVYDCTVSNSDRKYVVELKAREYRLTEKLLREGCLIDKDKIDELEKHENAYVVEFFIKENRTFVWDVHDKKGWKVEERTTPFEQGSSRKVTKEVYLMPFTEVNERDLDISGYKEYFEGEKIRLTNIYRNVSRKESI